MWADANVTQEHKCCQWKVKEAEVEGPLLKCHACCIVAVLIENDNKYGKLSESLFCFVL